MKTNNLIEYISFAVLAAFFVVFSIFFEVDGVKYDCRFAEISPDIPLNVKKLCRGEFNKK